ncbi:hypothetical protein Tco_1319721 [Tanacetum coccineum]
MAEIKTETTMNGFMTKDRADYYSGITRITVNGKNVYELKEKFLDDLLSNAFSGTNGEDAVEHIDYFLKIVDPINLLNVNYERIRLAIFPISLVENASVWFDEFKEFKEFNFLLKVDPELFTHDIERTKTYEDYENELNDELKEPWSEDGVLYEICDHICEPFRFKNGKAKWPTCNSNEDGLCNRGELLGMVRIGYMTYFQDNEWSFGNFHELDYELLVKLQDYWWKINNHECSPFSKWRDHIRGPYANFFTTYDLHLDINSIFGMKNNASNMSNVQNEECNKRCNLFNDTAHNAPVCKIRRFEMIKYSFGQDEEYVGIKEYEYDDLTKTNEDACRVYQEIIRSMDEGWVVIRAE